MFAQFAAVLLVFGLLGATLYFLKRRGLATGRVALPIRRPRVTSKTPLLEHADRLQLSPTHSLSVVRMGDRAILIGTSPSGFYLVESSPWKNVVREEAE